MNTKLKTQTKPNIASNGHAASDEMKIVYRRLDTILELPGNAKLHSNTITDSISTFGFLDLPGVNPATLHNLDGNGRIAALKTMYVSGQPAPKNIQVRQEDVDGKPVNVWYVPTVDLPFDRETEPIVAMRLNREHDKGGYDNEAVLAVLEQAKAFGRLEETGFDEEAMAALLAQCEADRSNGSGGDGNGEPSDAEPQIDKARELNEKWLVKMGDLWLIGNHKLLCGDCTKPADVARLMAGEKAVLMNTDPPYGVDYVASKNGIPRSGFAHIAAEKGDIENDDLTDGATLQAFLESAIRAAVPHLIERAAFYLWHPMLTQGTFFAAAAAAADILIHRQIIWVKPGFVLTRSGMYHWKHELCFYGWVRGNIPAWYGDKSQTSVWEIGREGDTVHPTQKPTELFTRPMLNHSKLGEIAYEPFAGSGSQYVAGQNLGRRVFGLEIEARYVAVILQRMSDAFPGLSIRKASDQPEAR